VCRENVRVTVDDFASYDDIQSTHYYLSISYLTCRQQLPTGIRLLLVFITRFTSRISHLRGASLFLLFVSAITDPLFNL
jgi:hypothetical protein